MISNIKIRIMSVSQAICEWHADGYRYFFWFNIKSGPAHREGWVHRKRIGSTMRTARTIEPTSQRHKPMMDKVLAYVEAQQLLPKALEAERIAREEEQARWREQRRRQVIESFGVDMYELLQGRSSVDATNILVRIDDALAKLDKELS